MKSSGLTENRGSGSSREGIGPDSQSIIRPKTVFGYGLFVVGIAILFTLGYWQLMRGLDKAAIVEVSATRGETEVLLASAPSLWGTMDYQSARLEGSWLNSHTFLLANRLYRGRVGYEVLVPFELEDDGNIVLVNRGWIAKPDEAQGLTVAPADDSDDVFGTLYRPARGFTLGDTYLKPVSWPLEILYYDFDALSAALGRTVQPVSLVLSPSSPHSFQRIWAATNMPPSRHYGYAVQWWGLTLTLLIFGLVWRRRFRRPARHATDQSIDQSIDHPTGRADRHQS